MTADITSPAAGAAETKGFLSEDWFDPLEAGGRTRIRSFIEELLEAELEAALGRKRYARGRAPEKRPSAEAARSPVSGHRHGHRERTLMGTFGAVTVCVPRARLATPEGGTTEWRNASIPAYQRLTRRAEALIASAYLSGTNTRRVRRALAALFGGAVGKDVVSRVWRKVKTDWDAWTRRDLSAEPIIRLILDGTVVRVRLDRKATAISLLVVLGVRRDGQKVLLAVKNMGGESEAAWRAILDDLMARGLRTPEFVIVDGAPGLEKALAALWPDVPAQRCTDHTIRTQLRSGLPWAVPARLRGAQWDDMADLQTAVADDDALDDELQDRLFVGERRLVQAGVNAITKRLQAGANGLGLEALATEVIALLLLALQGQALVSQLAEVLPIPTTGSVSAVVGRLITHSRLLRIIAKL